MPRLLQPLWLIFMSWNENLAAQIIEYQREELRILRGKLPKRIALTPPEKTRLVRYGAKLGPAIKHVITIVSPRTFARWLRDSTSPPRKGPVRKPGRPRTEEEIRDLILKIASETGWGYSRIHGELLKLGVDSVCRTTVANIMREAGFDPSPERAKGTWSEFLERHAKTLWASDFLSVKTMTKKGLVDLFVLFFIHPGTRRVIVGGVTANPDSAWMKQQARNVTGEIRDLGFPTPEILLVDFDSKYTKEFTAIFASEGTKVQRVGPRAPNLNAYAERFVQTLKNECLDHFVVFGESHLRHLVREFVEHYHDERPHQNLANVPPCRREETVLPFVKEQKIRRGDRLGGQLKHYFRTAA